MPGNKWVLFKMQTECKGWLPRNGSSGCRKATAVCRYQMPAGEQVQIGLWLSNVGMHLSHPGDFLKRRLLGPTLQVLIYTCGWVPRTCIWTSLHGCCRFWSQGHTLRTTVMGIVMSKLLAFLTVKCEKWLELSWTRGSLDLKRAVQVIMDTTDSSNKRKWLPSGGQQSPIPWSSVLPDG